MTAMTGALEAHIAWGARVRSTRTRPTGRTTGVGLLQEVGSTRAHLRVCEAIEADQFTGASEHVASAIGTHDQRVAGKVAVRSPDLEGTRSLGKVDVFARLMHELPVNGGVLDPLGNNQVAADRRELGAVNTQADDVEPAVLHLAIVSTLLPDVLTDSRPEIRVSDR